MLTNDILSQNYASLQITSSNGIIALFPRRTEKMPSLPVSNKDIPWIQMLVCQSESFYLFNFMHGLGMVSRRSQHGGKKIEKKKEKC